MSPATFLFEVTSVFTIRGRGICLEGLDHTQLDSVKKGDLVELRHPDGSVRWTEVVAVSYFQTYAKPRPPIEERLFPLLLPPSLTKADVPVGTTVWLKEQHLGAANQARTARGLPR